jgi:hypothetical protein
MADPLVEDMAEFQLHYFVPVIADAANYIYKVEINDKIFANNTTPLTTYNAVPSAGTGRFFTEKAGKISIKFYMSTALNLVYTKSVDLAPGKWNIFVYDFDKDPIVFDNGYPYETVVTNNTGEACWVKFYNFLYESKGIPTDLKIQYQYQYTMDISTKEKSEWLNVGSPVGFGETTGWQRIPVIKEVYISQGAARIDYKIRVQDENGNYINDLSLINTGGTAFVSYGDYWTATIGRRYHHIFGGYRAQLPIASVRQFVAQ